MIQVDWKEFVSFEELPLEKKLIVKFEENQLQVIELDKDENNEIYIEDVDIVYIKDVIKPKYWSTFEEKPKEKGSRVYLDFSESELEELQELFEYLKQRLEESFDESISTFRKSYERKLNNLKKFRDKFSKVEF